MSIQPPGPKGVPVFGNSGQYSKDPFSFMTACAEAYGDVVKFDLGPMPVYMLTNPEDIERVLVSEDAKFRKPRFQDDAMGDLLGNGLLLSDGAEWRKQRELAQPAFNPARIATLGGMMSEKTTAMLDDWQDGDLVDIQLEMARLTVRIIVDAMLGASLDEERIRTVQENLEPLGARFEPDPLRVIVPDWAPTRENRDYKGAIETIERVIDDIVAERRGSEFGASDHDGRDSADAVDDPPMDLLSIILRAQQRGEQTDQQLRDEMMTMLLAGHDTTALTLTYFWYLLSQHPDVEAKVQQEVDEVLGGETPAAADARQMTYTDRVLHETMRLYPPVYTMFREPRVDVRLGGYRVPEGSGVMLPQWVVHRSPRWYDDPETFDPDRWLPERRNQRPRFSYFPFGGGPRHCIGKQFSMLEAKLIVGTVAQQFELDYTRDEPFSLRGSLTMHPREPMAMRLRSR
ncbi:cytochrome P450 [Halogranum rubrum]|uniref:Cytochrome p450 n=1 Tax=Halogranum salarium B-1 TaxID=1210908 RepID=J3JG84_9EURY|nr:cytochrome P450 [Halogranum salarium]EJN59909.1 cytochrome p450 [Halogranum salarium B-1]